MVFFLAMSVSVLKADWEVISVNGQDYVTLESIATFYGMTPPTSAGDNQYAASGNGHSLKVRAGSRQALIDGVRHWLSLPVQKGGGSVMVSRVDVARTLEPSYRPTMVKELRPVNTVVLDAGHGGHDRGARSSYGFEKDFTLDVTARVRKRLEKAGVKVVQTRLKDSFITLEGRTAMARKYPNPIFVSIHFNSSDSNSAANGIEVFAIPPLGAPPTGQSKPQARDRMREAGHSLEPANMALATTVHHALLGGVSTFDRGVKRARFVVLKDATVPAVLIEGGFLSNPAEAARISSPQWREAYAGAIATGILEYIKLANQKASPRKVSDYGRSPTSTFVDD
jgi:N-acetylmuramoyl-L-alanine amidase